MVGAMLTFITVVGAIIITYNAQTTRDTSLALVLVLSSIACDIATIAQHLSTKL